MLKKPIMKGEDNEKKMCTYVDGFGDVMALFGISTG